jgi:hypothetical protein
MRQNRKTRAIIIEKFGTQTELAKKLARENHMHPSTLSALLNKHRPPTLREGEVLMNIFGQRHFKAIFGVDACEEKAEINS